MGKKWKQCQILSSWALISISVNGDWSHEFQKCSLLGGKAMTNSERILKSRDITVDKAPYSQTMLFPVVMYGCDCKEGWLPKNWCFQTEVLEKTFESHLDNKDIKLVIPKGNQPWIFIGRTDTEAEAPIFWPPDEKSQLLGQNSCDRKDWRQKEKRVTEDEMVGWHDQLDGHEFEQTLGNSEEQEACHGLQRVRCDLATGQWQPCKEGSVGL